MSRSLLIFLPMFRQNFVYYLLQYWKVETSYVCRRNALVVNSFIYARSICLALVQQEGFNILSFTPNYLILLLLISSLYRIFLEFGMRYF